MNATGISELLKCEFCKRTFETPILLPCGETMCKRDLTGLNEREEGVEEVIICYFCGEQHPMPEEGFPMNKIVENLLKHNIFFMYNSNDCIFCFLKNT